MPMCRIQTTRKPEARFRYFLEGIRTREKTQKGLEIPFRRGGDADRFHRLRPGIRTKEMYGTEIGLLWKVREEVKK